VAIIRASAESLFDPVEPDRRERSFGRGEIDNREFDEA